MIHSSFKVIFTEESNIPRLDLVAVDEVTTIAINNNCSLKMQNNVFFSLSNYKYFYYCYCNIEGATKKISKELKTKNKQRRLRAGCNREKLNFYLNT